MAETYKNAAEVSALALPDMPVFSVAEGAAIGRVKEVIIDPDKRCLLALAVDKGGWYHDVRVIAAGKIRTMGDDLIMVDEKQAAQPPSLPKIVANMKEPCNIIGARVITQGGRQLGRVDDFYLARLGGELTRLELACGVMGRLWAGQMRIAAGHIITLGADAVVVDEAAAKDVREKAGVIKTNLAAVAGWAGRGAEKINGGSVGLRVAAGRQWRKKTEKNASA